jgi:hypothetical protein
MSTFDGRTFKVILNDGLWYPNPVRDADGLPRYRAEILITDETTYRALQDLVSICTFKRPSGSMAINTHVEAGPGVKTLVVPTKLKQSRTYSAVLVALDAQGTAWMSSGFYRATAEWVITSDLTP